MTRRTGDELVPGPDDGRLPSPPLSDLNADELDALRAEDAEKNRRQQENIRTAFGEVRLEMTPETLAARRFARAREILAWLTAKSHYLEPPAFLLFHDGSGTLFVGEETMKTWPELGKEISRVVGSVRWGTRKRENGAKDITLHICGLELEEPIPAVE